MDLEPLALETKVVFKMCSPVTVVEETPVVVIIQDKSILNSCC